MRQAVLELRRALGGSRGRGRYRFVAVGTVCVFCLVVGASGVSAASPTVTAVDLGTLGGSSSDASALNDGGQVVGSSLIAGDAEYHAFSWTQAGGMVDLGTLGGSSSGAVAVNSSGQVVGSSSTAGDAEYHGFSWTQAGGMVNLGTLGGTSSQPVAVNSTGQVVGSSLIAGDAESHAFSWTQAGGMVDLGTLGGTFSQALAVASDGEVVGSSSVAGDASQHAFSWTQANGIVDLGTLGGSCSYATAVNGVGQVVGQGCVALDSAVHAFLWTQVDGMIDLGTLDGNYSSPAALNGSGQVVGYGTTVGDAHFHAFSWTQAGGMVDLGTFGGSSSLAMGVNNDGLVVGWSYTAGDAAQRAFSWTQADGMVDLGNSAGGTSSLATAVNNSAQVAGDSYTAGNNATHATLWQVGPSGPLDVDGDGIDDAIDLAPGTASNEFRDDATTAGAVGTIPAGEAVSVTDLPDPAGVRVTVSGTGSAPVAFAFTNPAAPATPCGPLELLPGSDVEVTCGSITVHVIAGSAKIPLSDDTSAIVDAGETATIQISTNESFTINSVIGGDGKVTIVSNGVSTPVGPSPTPINLWDFVGFSQPVDNNGVYNIAKAGSNIPLKWRLLSETGAPITNLASASVSIAAINCQGGAPSDHIDEVATSPSGLQNQGNGNYQLNWKTDKKWSGCKQMRLSLQGEGTIVHTAVFNFK